MRKNQSSKFFAIVLCTLGALQLSACGGSSSDSGGASTPPVVQPNILLIISDDQGLDASSQYTFSNDPPQTPVLDALAAEGLVFDNAWATPGCTTTRSSIITGKYGVHTDVTSIGDRLQSIETVLQKYLAETPATADYRTAIVGKWHLGGANPELTEPNDFGVPYYAGILQGSLSDYEDWTLTEQGQNTNSTVYSTSKLTDLAINWIDEQAANPWFMWLAYNAPHTPFHLPPASLHSSGLSGTATDINDNPRDYYLAAIEAMDTEIGRLLDGLPAAVRDNTVVMFVGDNGTPSRVRDQAVYANLTKSTLSEGGLRVPMVVSGAGVTRAGERESALINATDFFATVTDISGTGVDQIHDSISFKPLLSVVGVAHREYVYVDFDDDVNAGYAIKDSRYKYLKYDDGSEELYDLLLDSGEDNNLIGFDAASDAIADRLRAESAAMRS